jgi:hypothetical protein
MSHLRTTSLSLFMCILAVTGCRNDTGTNPDTAPVAAGPRFVFPVAVGTQWIYKHYDNEYSYPVQYRVTNGTLSWEVISQKTDTASTTATVHSTARDTTIATTYSSGVLISADTTYPLTVSAFTITIQKDSLHIDWPSAVGYGTSNGYFSRAITRAGDSVKVDLPLGQIIYADSVGLVSYAEGHSGTMGSGFQRSLTLVSHTR